MRDSEEGRGGWSRREREQEDWEDGDAAAEGSPLLVLLAEDDAAMRGALAVRLRADGMRVQEVEDGAALQRYLERALKGSNDEPTPDVVISDINMPGANGLEVLQWLRQRDWSIPVILITAFGDAEAHEEAERLGVTAVLDKPFDVDQLRTLIAELQGAPD